MEKGKYGIRLGFYAVMGFLFAIFGYSTALVLLAGVVIVGEKNEWASRQVLQALFLHFAACIVDEFLGLFSFMYRIPIVGTGWGIVSDVFTGLIDLAILVFAIIAIVNTAKGKEAGVPLASKFANWAYGIVVQKVKPVYQQPVYQQPMQQQPVYQQPVQQQPVYQQPAQQQPVQQQPVQQAPAQQPPQA